MRTHLAARLATLSLLVLAPLCGGCGEKLPAGPVPPEYAEAPLKAARKDDVAVLVQLACDRATAEPLVRRREALTRRLDALTPETLRDAAHFYLSDERHRVVVVGEK